MRHASNVGLGVFAIACALFTSASGADRSLPQNIDAERIVAETEYRLAKSYMRLEDGQPPFLNQIAESSGGQVKAKISVDFSKAIQKYRDQVHKDDTQTPRRTPQILFRSAIQRARRIAVAEPSSRNLEFLRNVVSDFIEAQTLVGNDALLAAFSSRFPSSRQSTIPSEITREITPGDRNSFEAALLFYADQQFREATDAIAILMQVPETIRKGDQYGLVDAIDDERKVRPSEFRLAFIASDRTTRTRLSDAKRRFLASAYGMDRDEVEERSAALADFGTAAHESYLVTASLASLAEDSAMMTRGGAGDLKNTLADSQQGVFEVSHGIQPRSLPKSYIPEKDAKEIFSEAIAAVADAEVKETKAKADSQQYYASINQLRQELQSQRDRFAAPLRDLTGVNVTVPVKMTNADGSERLFFIVHEDKHFANAERRALSAYLRQRVTNSMHHFAKALVESQLLSGHEVQSSAIGADLMAGAWQDLATTTAQPQPVGHIGLQLLQVREAHLSLLQQRRFLNDFTKRIRIEWDYTNEVIAITTAGREKIADNAFWARMADSISVSYPWGVSIQPLAIVSGSLQKDSILTEMRIQNDSLKADTKRRVEQLLLDQMQAYYEVQRTAVRLAKEHAILQSQLAQIDWLIDSWAESRMDASEVYSQYPAFLMYRDESERLADQAFDIALERCYIAARALEYQWAEAFQNPIRGRSRDISLTGYSQFTRTESLLGVKTAAELKAFLQALTAWHNELRKERGGGGGDDRTVVSIRTRVLGLSNEPKDQPAFTKWIREHLIFEGEDQIGLLFHFSTADDFLKPLDRARPILLPTTEWNQKIKSIAISIDGDRHFVPENETDTPRVELVPGGISFVRSFPAENDMYLSFDLQGLAPENTEGCRLRLMLGRKPDLGSYRNYMKIPASTNQNFVFHDYHQISKEGRYKSREDRIGVACSKWTALIDRKNDPKNFGLTFERIRDIRIAIQYEFNRDSAWVQLPQLP